MAARRAAALAILSAGLLCCSLVVDLDGISDLPPAADAAAPPADAGADAPPVPEAGGAVLRRMTFENGLLVDPVLGADRVEGTVLLESATPIAGRHAARVRGVADQGTSVLEVDLPRAPAITITLDLRVSTYPSDSLRVLRLVAAGATSGELNLRRDGALSVSTASASSERSAALALETVYSVRLRYAAGVLEGSVAPRGQAMGPAFGSTPAGSDAGIASIAIGQTVSTAYGMDIVVDDVVVGL